MNNRTIRTYHELMKLRTFDERFEYLKLRGRVGSETFGVERYLNQCIYHSSRWKEVREKAIVRDEGFDLGIPGHEIYGMIMVHHMNPITIEEAENLDDKIFDLEYLICSSFNTHEAIHYCIKKPVSLPLERKKGDTKLWGF